MNASEPLALRSDVVATVMEDGAILLDLETKYFYSLNHSGWAIVQLFESGVAVDAVRKQCRTWGATDEDMNAVDELVELLVRDRLIEPATTDESAALQLQSWERPRIEKQPEPLQRVIVSAFDPSIPLAE